MEKVILGFLMIRALTQYDILQAMQKKVSPHAAAAHGTQTVEAKQRKKLYISI